MVQPEAQPDRRTLCIDTDDNPHLAEYDGTTVTVIIDLPTGVVVRAENGKELYVADHELKP